MDFERNLKEAFQPFDAPGDALEEIKNLRMGNNLIEDHNAKFWILLTKSKLDKTSPAVIDYYWETLNLLLQKCGSLDWNYPQPLYRSGMTNPLDTTIFSKKSNESLDEEYPIMIRKRNQSRKLGLLPRKTPMRWMWTSCPLKKETKQWGKEYVLDVENMDILIETAQTRRRRL